MDTVFGRDAGTAQFLEGSGSKRAPDMRTSLAPASCPLQMLRRLQPQLRLRIWVKYVGFGSASLVFGIVKKGAKKSHSNAKKMNEEGKIILST